MALGENRDIRANMAPRTDGNWRGIMKRKPAHHTRTSAIFVTASVDVGTANGCKPRFLSEAQKRWDVLSLPMICVHALANAGVAAPDAIKGGVDDDAVSELSNHAFQHLVAPGSQALKGGLGIMERG
jgi:hypothetical protein